MPYTLGFTGDVMLGRTVDERQRNRPVAAVWGDVLDRLRDLDALFVNLESCLSTRGRPWRRTHRPFHFRADPEWAVPALREAGVAWASLANNHLLDFEAEALVDTLDALDEARIARSGAGRDEREARAPATVDVDGLRAAFVSVTDNTPEYAAGPDAPGVARLELDPDDPDERHVARSMLDRASEADPDLLVASLHWGPNMVEEPFEDHERWGRWLLSEGVDVIHDHSAHVFNAVEAREDGLILYDCGDFVDDYRVDRELRNDRSFLFELTVDDGGSATELRLVPVEIGDWQVRLATGDAARWCRETMVERSRGYGTEFRREGETLVVAL
jgi:poly-gamma-glutamate synthesis protein (capsule biosynthesis protein)